MKPTARGLWLLAGLLGLACAAVLVEPLVPAWRVCGGGVLGLALFDVLWLARASSPKVSRTTPKALAVGNWHTVTLRVESSSRAAVRGELFDLYPVAMMQLEGLPAALKLPRKGWAEVTYRLRPTQRGEAHWGKVELLRVGPLGLMARKLELGEPSVARVYPDFRQVAKFSMLALDQRTSQMGIHVRPKRGEGLEFFQLREYRDGDSMRQVDWKASSKRRALISREYREEQNQQIMVLLDCGRRMRALDGELSHFDQVLNAALLLAHAALREGDAVGMLSFSGTNRFVAPVKGAGAIHTLVSQLYDVHATQAPSDYEEAIARLTMRQRRRALVVLLTNLRDDDSRDLPRLLRPLRARHLVLVGSMREAVLDEAAQTRATDFQSALTVAAAEHYLEQRRSAHEDLRRSGLWLVDVPPQRLPVALVNSYLEIKRAGLL
jgi:uncharacterized protein (DUF58 family)